MDTVYVRASGMIVMGREMIWDASTFERGSGLRGPMMCQYRTQGQIGVPASAELMPVDWVYLLGNEMAAGQSKAPF